MKRIILPVLVIATIVGTGTIVSLVPASGQAAQEAAPIYGIKLPAGYRDWTMVSAALVGAPLNDLRVKLGNDVAMKAFRDDSRQFPDGTIIARLAYQQVTSEENNRVFRAAAEQRGMPAEQIEKLLAASFVAGPPPTSSSWLRTQKNMPRPAVGGLHNSPLANLMTKLCTKPALPATSRPKITISSSPGTFPEAEKC